MPNVVKGSKQQQMVVVPRRPRPHKLLIVVAVLVGITVSTLGGWAYGRYRTLLAAQFAEADRRGALLAELDAVQTENAALKSRLAMLERASIIDQRSNEAVQASMRVLQERIAQLEQDISYYRQVVSGTTVTRGTP